MTTYILIALMSHGIAIQEFTSLEKCNKAGNAMVGKHKELAINYKTAGFVCVER